MNKTFLIHTMLFQGTTEEEVTSMLQCLQAVTKEYKKEEMIFHAGDVIDSIGLVLEGGIYIENDDIWGNKSILDHVQCGQIFAETYAMLPKETLMVNVVAAKDSRILFLSLRKLMQTCNNSCPFHNQIIRNLLSISAQKNLNLSRRIFFTSSKTIRGRLVSYLSQQAKQAASCRFTIPFNRQQLADYLGVDRSALSNELSKMRKEGILTYSKNTFHILTPSGPI